MKFEDFAGDFGEFGMRCSNCLANVYDGELADENGKMMCDCFEMWKDDASMFGYPKQWIAEPDADAALSVAAILASAGVAQPVGERKEGA